MADYISREAVIKMINESNAWHPECAHVLGPLRREIMNHQPADVVPRATIESGIEEAIALLNAIRGQAINGDGQLDYPAYSELHDTITGILPEKEADSDG